jgi:hypothetical protein
MAMGEPDGGFGSAAGAVSGEDRDGRQYAGSACGRCRDMGVWRAARNLLTTAPHALQ